jgi:hypothetical protein
VAPPSARARRSRPSAETALTITLGVRCGLRKAGAFFPWRDQHSSAPSSQRFFGPRLDPWVGTTRFSLKPVPAEQCPGMAKKIRWAGGWRGDP